MMETKEIVEKLRYYAECHLCYVECSVAKEAADRLEELEEISENWCSLNDENMELLRKYRDDITELKQQLSEQQNRWISVEDRLPEKAGRYLVSTQRMVYVMHFEAEKFIFSDITHWMPLPEPPKPKELTFKDVFLAKAKKNLRKN